MSAKRYRSISGSADVARAGRGSFAAAAALAAALLPLTASAQEFAYCDLAVVQQASKLQQNVDAAVISTGERRKHGIRLTEEKPSQRGTVFHKIPIGFMPGASLYQHFRVRIAGGGANAPQAGGEGFAFILANDPGGDPLMVGKLGTGVKALGAGGDGFGYKGITQSFALEFDTLMNAPAGDPDGNHISLDIGGQTNHTNDGTTTGAPWNSMPEGSSVAPWQPIALDPSTSSIESSAMSYDTRDVWVDYECAGPDSCSMRVYMSFNNAIAASGFADATKPGSLPKKPGNPIMVVDGLTDIAGYMNGPVGFAGFSASTGSTMNEHLVTYWVVSRSALFDSDGNGLEDVCECKSVPACNGSVPICDQGSTQGFCRDCLNDNECGASLPSKPICDLIATGGTGACVECALDVHCPVEKPYCNAAVHECTSNCTTDTECDGKKWCDNPTGVPYGGTCQEDLPNGAPIPSSGNHTPALDGTCTTEVGALVCISGACDPSDNACGLVGGTPCASATGTAQCRSGICTGAGVCGCENDAECGEVASGLVCDDMTRQCHDGCRGTGGNTCPKELVCDSKTGEIGVCVKPPPAVTGPHVTGGSVEGGGIFGCGTSGRSGSGEPAALLLVAAAFAGRLARRRRRAS